MLKFSNILMAAVVVMMAMAPAFAQDNKQETEAKEVKTQVELFARTGMEPVPKSAERGLAKVRRRSPAPLRNAWP